MEVVAAGFSPKVWYRTPGLVVSFLEDTGKNKNKQENKIDSANLLLKSLKKIRGNVCEYIPPSKTNAIRQLMTLSK